ncbi:MAG TPA: hypothetical protein VGO62_03645, partial [Myxococcota bacterium]
MPAVSRDFLLLSKDRTDKAAAGVGASFLPKGKRKELAAERHAEIVEPLVALSQRAHTASLVYSRPTVRDGKKDGDMLSILVEGSRGAKIQTFHWKPNNGFGGAELRIYPPLSKSEFTANKLDDDVNALYGWRGAAAHSITVATYGSTTELAVDEKHIESLDGAYAQQILIVAQALIRRASLNHDRMEANKPREVEPGVAEVARAQQKSLAAVLVNAKPRADAKSAPPLGGDLCGAASWNGAPIVLTSDADGTAAMHVMIERPLSTEAGGKKVWWPLTVPSDPSFPRRGAALVVSGNRLEIVGGVDGDDKALSARWSLDLQRMSASNFTELVWSKKGLKDGVAWAAVAEDDKDSFVAGGVAGFWLTRAKSGDGDVKQLAHKNTFAIGGFPDYLERAPAPQTIIGSSAVAKDGFFLVGPGNACDGAMSLYSKKDKQWFRLPTLPENSGLGQVSLDFTSSSRAVIYTGGFTPAGAALKNIWRLDLDGSGAWEKLGSSDAVAGNARVVERDNKRVALLVARDAALMVHLE